MQLSQLLSTTNLAPNVRKTWKKEVPTINKKTLIHFWIATGFFQIFPSDTYTSVLHKRMFTAKVGNWGGWKPPNTTCHVYVDLNAFLARQLHIQTVHLNYYLKTTANKNLEKHRHGKGDTHIRTIHSFRCPSCLFFSWASTISYSQDLISLLLQDLTVF